MSDWQRSMTKHGPIRLVAGDLPEDRLSTPVRMLSRAQVTVGSLGIVASVIVDPAQRQTEDCERSASTSDQVKT